MRHEIDIHDGLRVFAELSTADTSEFVFLGVADESGDDQIAFVETGPDRNVLRAMRDTLTALLGDADDLATLRAQLAEAHAVAARAMRVLELEFGECFDCTGADVTSVDVCTRCALRRVVPHNMLAKGGE